MEQDSGHSSSLDDFSIRAKASQKFDLLIIESLNKLKAQSKNNRK